MGVSAQAPGDNPHPSFLPLVEMPPSPQGGRRLSGVKVGSGTSYIYYYLRNAQGDIVKLIDSNGNTVVEYPY